MPFSGKGIAPYLPWRYPFCIFSDFLGEKSAREYKSVTPVEFFFYKIDLIPAEQFKIQQAYIMRIEDKLCAGPIYGPVVKQIDQISWQIWKETIIQFIDHDRSSFV